MQLGAGQSHHQGVNGGNMTALETLLDTLPDAARDLRLNVGSLLESTSLSLTQRWGVVVACALSSRNAALREAVVADARAVVGDDVIDDAVAATAVMGMNNVFYRFRHLIGKETYTTRPARLRMNRLASPKTTKADLELFCLAVSAIHGCEVCVRSHEEVVLQAGLSEEQVFDAVRTASVIHGVALALDAGAALGA